MGTIRLKTGGFYGYRDLGTIRSPIIPTLSQLEVYTVKQDLMAPTGLH